MSTGHRHCDCAPNKTTNSRRDNRDQRYTGNNPAKRESKLACTLTPSRPLPGLAAGFALGLVSDSAKPAGRTPPRPLHPLRSQARLELSELVKFLEKAHALGELGRLFVSDGRRTDHLR